VPKEIYTNQPQGNYYKPLDTLTSAQSNLWAETSKALGQSGESFPFVYLGGSYVLDTAQVNPAYLEGKSFSSIAATIGDNSSTIGSNIDAASLAMVKYICTMTGNKPASVCAQVAAVQAPVQSTSSSTTGPSSPSG
jgi:hypothetical protein